MAAAAAEEEVMKMRLLVDGDGTGDDRRMNMLLKVLIKWCNDDDPKTFEVTYNRLLTQLANIEWNMSKSRLVAQMNEAELQNYELIQSVIEQGIVGARREIEETKVELGEAKLVRKNRLEYDSMAKVIHTHPTREESAARLDSLAEEQSALKEKEKVLEEKLETRRKQFSLLMSTLHQLQTLVEEEDGVVKPGQADTSQESNGSDSLMEHEVDTTADLE